MTKDSQVAVAGKKAGAYHHGNLRHALIAAARELIRAEGVSALSLRKVGKQLGVSQAALYNHFTDKTELLAAVAAEGFRELAQAQAEADRQERDPARRIQAQGIAYVRFALAAPNLYRLMFGDELANSAVYPELQESRKVSFEFINRAVRDQLQQAGATDADPYLAVTAARVVVHGLASLLINGLVTPSRTLTPAEQEALMLRMNAFFAQAIEAMGHLSE